MNLKFSTKIHPFAFSSDLCMYRFASTLIKFHYYSQYIDCFVRYFFSSFRFSSSSTTLPCDMLYSSFSFF